ncbi:hypothetical protein ERJ70_03920 [Sediminibacillus dalangtanensis]|uniref:DUF4367 domain-containing protein n=1 Tax=Sediminibacillus dalangtanensis TaxID=2729421 RepID=A0ABX7VVZ7_9BACI|nr:hypothetical protein [Sediminibacillus dalangtanensis]QTM98517.1 hypothetical protein ERJ70_03920 [Sediminibacillus dalangtanensis]
MSSLHFFLPRIFLLMSFLLFLAACQQSSSIPEGFYDYQKEKAESAAAELSFSPDLPEYVPMEVAFLVSDRYYLKDNENEALDISFYTQENDLLSIQFMKGDIDTGLVEAETVTIDDQLEGKYVDNSFAKILSWKRDGITYKMSYRENTLGVSQEQKTGVSKQDLVQVAHSFHS